MIQQQTLTEQDINDLLNKNISFDQHKVNILDKVIGAMYGTDSSAIMIANQILQKLKNDPDFWLATDIILEKSQNNNTKFLSLVILEDAIKLKWNAIPENQQTAIKNYAMNMVINLGQQQNREKQIENLLSKANSILVQIVKYEWNTKWRQFIPEICGSSMTNQLVCENNLHILKLLSEEIFDYSKNTMTSKQVNELKNNMINEFKQIFDLCYFISKQFIIDSSQIKISLMKSCLETLYSFMSWVPISYIFEGDLIDLILIPLIDHPQFRILTIRCLTEISLINIKDIQQQDLLIVQEKLLSMYVNFINRINNVLPSEINLGIEWKKMLQTNRQQISHFEELARHTVLFFTEFFKTHIYWIEKQNYQQDQQIQFLDLIRKGLQYIVEINQLPEDQIFKICIEFWHFLCAQAYQQMKDGSHQQQQSILLLSIQNPTIQNQIYPQIFIQVRKIAISKMAKPEEVLITTDDQGNAVRVLIENTENNSLYELMKDLLVNLSLLDWNNMYQIMQEKLERQLDGSEFSFDNLNTLCWAIGSISGTLPEQEEKTFLIMTIRILLNLCENKKGKENKATIASNIMYVVGQYPKFLRSNWNFLKTVIKKLFEFMHETFPGVMDMAVNTFLKIAKQCKEEFVKVHSTIRDDHMSQRILDNEPYIWDLIRNIPEETNVLENKHRLVFYEALGYIIGAEKNEDNIENLLANTIQELYSPWKQIIEQGQQNQMVLKDEYNMDCLQFFLKVNERIAFSVGHQYHKILFKFINEITEVYRFYSTQVNESILQGGKLVLNHTVVKRMRGIKKSILLLIQTYIEKSQQPQFVVANIQMCILTILNCYSNEITETREAELLLCFATIIEKLNINLESHIPTIFQHIFQATLSMITQDFNSYPDHRINFFQFLKAVVIHAFPILYQVPEDQFQIMMNCILWAIKHDLPNIFDIGLDVLKTLLDEVNKNSNIISPFYEKYFMTILQEILYVLTDSFHKNGFKVQAQILFILLKVVMSNAIINPFPGNTQNIQNQEFVYNCIVTSLSQSFQNISKQYTEQYIQQLFVAEDFIKFKTTLRDYLIQLSTFSTDHDMLYEQGEINPNKQ